jgi:hypothetical protein
MEEVNKELEERKVIALEKIATILDSLTIWFEEIDKEEWSNRFQYYLAEYHKKYIEEE